MTPSPAPNSLGPARGVPARTGQPSTPTRLSDLLARERIRAGAIRGLPPRRDRRV